MRRLRFAVPLAAALLVLGVGTARARDPGVDVKLVLESGEVNAGETLSAAAVVTNPGSTGRFVLVEGTLAPVEEPIGIPPVTPWERFVYLLLAKISGDCECVWVPAGESRAVKLEIEVHPRIHGRFSAVAVARTQSGAAKARADVISKITAPPSNGAVLVHGRVYELGPYRLLVTDDGHLYEPKGKVADRMYDVLDVIYPRPDGVTVLGGILPNTLGGFGVELSIDFFRYDRDPGQAVGVRFRTLARGRSPKPYSGPDEEVTRDPERFEEIVRALGADLVSKPNFRKEMVAAVTTAGTKLTSVRVTRIYEKDGTLHVHYQVVNPALSPKLELPEAEAWVFAQPYHLVALPKHSGPVEFHRHDVSIRTDAYRTGVLDIEESLDIGAAAGLSRGGQIDRSLRKEEKARSRVAAQAAGKAAKKR